MPHPLEPFNFNEPAAFVPCSANVCINGHEWEPVLAIAKCPGCAAPIQVIKMLNCPLCNEPVERVRFRTDHLASGGQIAPMCRGSASLAEVTSVELIREHAREEERAHIVKEVPQKL